MKTSIIFEKYVDIRDAEIIVNYADQGWKITNHDKYHSYMVTLTKFECIEVDCPELYAKSINAMGIGVQLAVTEFAYRKDGTWHVFKITEAGEFKEE
jgi:hypothetical protein